MTLLFGAEFAHPKALWLLAALPLLYAVIWRRARREARTAVLRMCALALLVVALADPTTHEQTAEEELVALFDVSHSIDAEGRNALAETLMPFLKGDGRTLRLRPFGKTVAKSDILVDGDDSAREIADSLRSTADAVDSGQTNIAAALDYAIGQSAASSVLLLSDGHETAGDAGRAAAAARGAGVRIFPLVPPESHFDRERLSIASLWAPVTANAGDLAELRASVRNEFATDQTAVFELWLDQKKLFDSRIAIPAGQEKLIELNTPALDGGLKRVRAVLREDRTEAPEAEAHRWISVKNKAKILLISGTQEDRRVMGRLLALKGYAVEDIIADGQTEIPSSFENVSTVILNNASAQQLPRGFLGALKEFVQRGGGLLLLGGDRSFGLGGYIETPLEEISPLKFVPPRTTKRRLNSAIALVVDKSRSMLSEGKIDAAKRAALISIEALKDDDLISIIGFDSAPFVIIKMAPVPEVKPKAERLLRNLTAAGKTNLFPALGAARRALASADASRKHIIILTDGKVSDPSEDYTGEILRLQRDGISVSTVALGLEADVPFLKLIAQGGKGAFYQTLDPSRLPEIFVHDIKVSTGEKTMKENQDFPIAIGPGGLASTDVESYPVIRGFVETLPKRGATLELITQRESQRHPLLASWSFGDGRVIAFTSDTNGRWSERWIGWPLLARFWSQVIESAKSRGNAVGEIDFDLRYRVERGRVVLDLAVYDDRLQSEAPPSTRAAVVEPGGETRTVSFRSEAKGRFTAIIENGRPGDYKLEVQYGRVKLPPLALTIPGDAFGEKPGNGLNVQALSDIAYLSGGALNPDPAQVAGTTRINSTRTHLMTPLIVLAFFLLLTETLLREMGPVIAGRIRRRHQAAAKPVAGTYERRRRAA